VADTRAVARFFRSPKGMLIVLLTLLTAVAAIGGGVRRIAPGVASAVLAAALTDLPLLRWRRRRWEVPSGAILTGLIVAMLLSPAEPWYVGAVTSVIAVVSKYVFRVRTANVFNPAALGIVATFYIFDTGQSWWGALPELPLSAVALLLAAGVFITVRVNKVALVISFLAAYYALFTIAAFVGNPAHVAEIFRAPDLHAVLYFAFFILTDPPTSPNRPENQWSIGILVALASFAIFEWTGVVYYLLAAVLIGNAMEAARRMRNA
jgi:Na+-translocating ferredoxin:NAD+ oxidoreductase RnfD subunit